MLQVGEKAPQSVLHPIMGLPVDMKRQTTVLVFLRPVTGSQPRRAVALLQEAWPRFDAAGVAMVALTQADLTFTRDFVPRYHVLYPLVCDTTGDTFRAYDVQRDRGFMGSLTSLRPDSLRTAVAALELGRDWTTLPSDQLPAFFVVARDGTVKYARYGRSVTEQPDIEALWAAAAP